METTFKTLEKKQSHAFGKDIYLLGQDAEGINYWLEAPKWDCGWYWGFGYIETYTINNSPEHSKDISSHQHAGEDFHARWFSEWNGSKPILVNRTFNENEGWEISELFKQFYFLRDAAEYFHRGKCNVANTTIELWANEDLVKEINEVRLPKVMNRIIEILTPVA